MSLAQRIRTIQALVTGCTVLLALACESQSSDRAGVAGSSAVGGSSGGDASATATNAAGASGMAATSGAGGPPLKGDTFAKRVLSDGLGNPWEIAWGPDQWLWVTERTGRRVTRINPSDGSRSVALEIEEVRQEGSQDGLLGMALHPQLLANQNADFVYVAYSYDAASGRRFKIRRYTYHEDRTRLEEPLDVLTDLPASSDHNSGRLLIGPDEKLYYAIGDQGENQFERKCNPDRAQDLPTRAQVDAGDFQTYPGKILRMNLDGSIPDDNPELNGVRSHVFSFGHRNAQGLVFTSKGVLFADEQGPKSDDELNRIQAGKNYGWPYVAGFRDDQAYVYGNWSAAPDCQQLGYDDYTLPSSVPQQKESAWNDPNFAPPLMTFYTVPSDHPFRDAKCGAKANICWPTIAPSSLEFYAPKGRPLSAFGDSLLITSLKAGTVFRVALSADGQGIVGDATPLFKTTNRYRDIAVNPDGRTFYVATDADGPTSTPEGGATDSLDNKGALLEFKAVD